MLKQAGQKIFADRDFIDIGIVLGFGNKRLWEVKVQVVEVQNGSMIRLFGVFDEAE